MSADQTEADADRELEKHTYLLRTTKDLWEAYKETLLKSQEFDEVFQIAIIEHIMDNHPEGEAAVPDHWLEWYEDPSKEMPRKRVTTGQD